MVHLAATVGCVLHRVRVKHRSRYRPGVAQMECRSIALLFHDLGNRRRESSAARCGRTLSRESLIAHLKLAGLALAPITPSESFVKKEIDRGP